MSKRKVAQTYRFAAGLNAVILMILAVCIGVLATNRLQHPHLLNSALVIATGIVSIVINFWAAGLLFKHRSGSTVAAPYVGLLFSGLSGIGVLGSGIIAHVWGVYRVDGIIGIGIAMLLFVRSSRMLYGATWRSGK